DATVTGVQTCALPIFARAHGRVTATEVMKTAAAPARVALAADRGRIRADGDDLAFVTVTVRDRAGIAVPTAEPLVRFRVSGDARSEERRGGRGGRGLG